MHVVVETASFIVEAKAAGLSGGEVDRIVDYVARRPDAGDVIQGTGGARKVRFAGCGKGKSGGYRVITFHSGGDFPVFLLTVFAKVRLVQGGTECPRASHEGASRQLPGRIQRAQVTP